MELFCENSPQLKAESEIKSVAFNFTSFRLAIYLWTKLVYPGEWVSRQKSTFLCLVVNDASIQKTIMIDTVHEHECLIFLSGFNVHFVSNLTYLHSYILVVWC